MACAWFQQKCGALQVAAGSPPRVSSRSPAFTTGRCGTLMISPRGSGMQSPAGLCRTPAVRLPPVSRSQAAGGSDSPLQYMCIWRPHCTEQSGLQGYLALLPLKRRVMAGYLSYDTGDPLED